MSIHKSTKSCRLLLILFILQLIFIDISISANNQNSNNNKNNNNKNKNNYLYRDSNNNKRIFKYNNNNSFNNYNSSSSSSFNEDSNSENDPNLIIIPGFNVTYVDIFWGGGVNLPCSGCNGWNVTTYACAPNNNGDTRGNWNDGCNQFMDPMPKDAVLQQIGFTLYGTFACDGDSSQDPIVQLTIQDEQIGNDTKLAAIFDCDCATCVTNQSIAPVYVPPKNLYNTSGINEFQISVVDDDIGICLYKIRIYLYYTIGATPNNNNGGRLTTTQWIIISSSITGGLLIFIIAFVFIKKKIGRMGYKKIRDGKNIDINEVTLGERIGKGNFGEVYKGFWRGAVVAVKKLPAHNITEHVMKEFHREIELMKNLRHPNVIQFLGSCTIPPNICICTEYMPKGSLYSILHDPKLSLSGSLIRKMCLDAVKGIIYLHNSNPVILHRDLKSHNLLVDENFKVKVADFGLSTIEQTATMTACGTPCWTAPEVLRNQRYTEKADVYSFGIVMWECATRSDPYHGMPPFQVIFAVGREGLRPPTPKGPKEFVTLITDCWAENPESRPSMENIMVRLEMLDITGWQDVVFKGNKTIN